MNSFQAISVKVLAAACFALAPTVCRAGNDLATVPARAVTETNAPPPKVASPTHRLEEGELRTLLIAALSQRRNQEGAQWELLLTRPWTPLMVPDAPLTAEILEPTLNRITSICILRFELRSGQKTIGSWQTPVQARLWREIPVAQTHLRRGQLLREADFTNERRDLLALREPLVELPAQGIAYELAESVSPGAPLNARAIRLKPVLTRGQMADAIIRDGAMIISLKVEVLEEGVPGQVVRVRNPQSRRELRGKVLDEQTVAIPL
jgi:flagella basal body P-ring formation protein FlgA